MNRDKNRDVSSGVTASYFILWRMIRKDWCERCRAFPERVCPRILSLESVEFFATSEYFSESFDGEAINWSGVVNFHFMQMSLAVYFRQWLKWRAMFIAFLVRWHWCYFSGIVFRVFIHAYSIIVEYDVKRKYPEEYPTVDKVGSEKKRGNPVSCRINRLLISYLISKQARVTAF